MKGVTSAGELLSKLDVVVDLAVEDDDELAVGGGHRLPALGRQVDDGQPAVAETETAVGPERAVVRTTMRQQIDEPPPALAIHARIAERNVTEDSAHDFQEF